MQMQRVSDKEHSDSLNYLLYLPRQYHQFQNEFPLIVFLHGLDKRGFNIATVRTDGLPKILEENLDFPFIVVSPQCPHGEFWPMHRERVIEVIDEVSSEFSVDSSRIYLTGLSMGGYGTWDLAMATPEKFAAIIPISEGCETRNAHQLRNIPIWAFHGENDDVIPLCNMEEMVTAVRASGGNVKLTVLKDTGHDAWTQTYADERIYSWLINQKKDSGIDTENT